MVASFCAGIAQADEEFEGSKHGSELKHNSFSGAGLFQPLFHSCNTGMDAVNVIASGESSARQATNSTPADRAWVTASA